jgi:hypothetical protein
LTSTFPGQDAVTEVATDRAAPKIEALAAKEQWLIIAPQYSRTFPAGGLETGLKAIWEQS